MALERFRKAQASKKTNTSAAPTKKKEVFKLADLNSKFTKSRPKKKKATEHATDVKPGSGGRKLSLAEGLANLVGSRPQGGRKQPGMRLRFWKKLSPMLMKFKEQQYLQRLKSGSTPASRPKPKTHELHLLLERRWLGLDERMQRKRQSLGSKAFAAPMLEGFGVKVHAVFKSKAKADQALAAALSQQTEVEREGGIRERSELVVKAFKVPGHPDDPSSASEPGIPAWVDGVLTRRVYIVSASVGESFTNNDLAPGLVHFEGNYFFTSAEDEEEAKRLEEQRGCPWGYPHNARILCAKPGEVLKVFSSPISECGANAYATGKGLKDLQVSGLDSLHAQDLSKVVTYSKDGCAQVKLHRAEAEGSLRLLLTVSEHDIADDRPLPTPLSNGNRRS
eukprot:TRINITY_DN33077_c0_g1_i1.p1 TRINITY_DN33077_c0_g1~~TRINITY_DN33077_c0_g1_i1.p1  ORF type:complete len:393 (+),score=89.04 TRINITY_DN33077_c0_g1_i1:79-1257(+)